MCFRDARRSTLLVGSPEIPCDFLRRKATRGFAGVSGVSLAWSVHTTRLSGLECMAILRTGEVLLWQIYL